MLTASLQSPKAREARHCSTYVATCSFSSPRVLLTALCCSHQSPPPHAPLSSANHKYFSHPQGILSCSSCLSCPLAEAALSSLRAHHPPPTKSVFLSPSQYPNHHHCTAIFKTLNHSDTPPAFIYKHTHPIIVPSTVSHHPNSPSSMARRLLCTVLLLHLIAALASARPAPAESKVESLQLGGPHLANAPSSSSEEPDAAGAPDSPLRHGKHHHRPFDKSIAGAEVIVGGLAAAIFVAIFAYIRVTRKRSQEGKV
ncbi:hypothetical protein Cni_G12154 [Canna indica]|uniref:Transmembrane protein n=1 Tax=Canna indica TaxID=4628 RepID=A0AAQ3QA90_9LILI|nr:hypothetical protein Cni_G12154 [Canna indica]